MLIAVLLVLAGVQDATVAQPAVASDGTQRWSILADPCASPGNGDDIVVCGRGIPEARLPLPAERGPPDRPMPSNPNLTGMGALAAAAPPCAAAIGGCTVGVDVFGGAAFLVRAAGKIIDPDSCCDRPGEATDPVMLVNDIGAALKRGRHKKSDTSNRVPIPLDDPAPATARAP
ncbi:hypothetical protein [Sphingomonas sp.]|uniref:hypothetical protein n=1 Tax=Sphingomonas sp. TaxID=28214 RepID=UPI002C59C20E|nr:hypothetical protein [Sphingomonas sp.]HWK36939.1 hypothetical protein [Sphingomonas sp.]